METRRNGSKIVFFRRFSWLYVAMLLVNKAVAFSETKAKRPRRRPSKPAPSLQVRLQGCFTPASILKDVAVSLTPKNDSSGALSSVTLVRLSKQLVSLENKRNNSYEDDTKSAGGVFTIYKRDQKLWHKGLTNAVKCLVSSDWEESENSLEAAVEGIKAASVISRLLPKCEDSNADGINHTLWWNPLLKKIVQDDLHLATIIQPHQLSALKWSIDCFRLSTNYEDISIESLPVCLQKAYDDLDLPFLIRPGFLTNISSSSRNDESDFTLSSFVEQVDFKAETIQTTSKRAVVERRQTAWQGDEHVAPFEYSGKSMERVPWSPVVASVRDRLCQETSHYYDGCLLNLYPDGGSGMRYHIDPDQGVYWGFETVVVSIGATRRFGFRSLAGNNNADGPPSKNNISEKGTKSPKPHTFVLMDGDATEMVRDCQERFQHTVKTAEFKGETAPRVSLVFKKTLAN